ncbi:MAG: hypothetical protein GXY50_10910 [Syntrophomonadaceae bacterium]|nr:hypothetical protein [Syntrophomonadaceae bacterium]
MKKQLVFFLASLLTCIMLTGCGTAALPGDSQAPSSVNHEEPGGQVPQPILGNQITDGTYPIQVSSSSSMFRIIDAQLTVTEGEMWAVLTLSGQGYLKLYMGTGKEALADTDDKCIYYAENDEGKYTYRVPVTALNQDINVAAWSIRKETWYDRVLVFQSDLIPEDAIKAE